MQSYHPLHAGTAMVVISGIALGPETGFFVGALARFVCNFFSGQGPWTPWQMFSWGLMGYLAGCALIPSGSGAAGRGNAGRAFFPEEKYIFPPAGRSSGSDSGGGRYWDIFCMCGQECRERHSGAGVCMCLVFGTCFRHSASKEKNCR